MTTRGERFRQRSALPVDPKEAWDSAHYRRENSNLARGFIEAVEILKMVEWVIGRDECPCCIRTQEAGHAMECRLAAIINPINHAL